jgi:hypothetical protein
MSEIKELLERFRRGPEVMAVVLTGLGVEEQDYRTEPGKWTIREIVAHVADSEIIGAQRFRQVIAEDNPTVMAYDQEAWARNLDYARRKPAASLESFRRIRAENYELLKELPAATFERAGNHTERGRETLGRTLAIYAEHAETHAQQIQAIRDRYRQARGARGAGS